jgi:hypothetical protein
MLKAMTAAVLVFAATGMADTPAKYYKLDFVLKEVESNKILNSRSFVMMVPAEKGGNSIRTGSKVPIVAKDGSYSYVDVGVNIDCSNPQETDGELAMRLTVEVTSSLSESTPPVVRQNRWSSNIAVPIRKPTLAFSSDDATTKRQIQVEVTATPLK